MGGVILEWWGVGGEMGGMYDIWVYIMGIGWDGICMYSEHTTLYHHDI
jgi:hypothetical protein